ncbi:MAG: ATP-binding protein [Anaerolineae bacterium]|nr:ATP-binding protein [Anaerolineae bacterium]
MSNDSADFLNADALRMLEQASSAERRRDYRAARTAYLRASELLLQAAEQGDAMHKRQRLTQAQDLVRRAKALPNSAEHLPSPAPAKTSPPMRQGPAQKVNDEDKPAADWLVTERPKQRFDDVAGLDEVKEQIRLRLIYPFTHPDEARKYGVRAGGGLLMYGPPGTGKTMIARAIAGEVDAVFFAVKPSEIMSKWVGEAEQNIQLLFETARQSPRAVIFIDEVEALVPKRRESGSTIMQRVVPQILQELEGFGTSKAGSSALMFIGATNEPWSLDPAVMRPGRFDEKVYVPLPDTVARRRLIELSLRERPIAPTVEMAALTEALAGYSGADIVNICAKACALPFIESVQTGVKRQVLMADFEAVLAKVRPSVLASELAKYERFAQQG